MSGNELSAIVATKSFPTTITLTAADSQNVSYTPASGDLVATLSDGTEVIYNNGDAAWVLASTALVWIMVPGVGFFYSGLLRRKNALSMIFFSMAAIAVGSFQWFFWGYSLAFADNASSFIGTLRYFGLMNVLDAPSIGSTKIPALLFCFFQGMFAIITACIAMGGLAERSRVGEFTELNDEVSVHC